MLPLTLDLLTEKIIAKYYREPFNATKLCCFISYPLLFQNRFGPIGF